MYLTATFEMVSQKLHGDFDLTSYHLSINVGFYIILHFFLYRRPSFYHPCCAN